jgi:two-component system chemotaxis response regulator CheY
MATILVVDDSGYARRVHRRILESGDHTVHEASTGLEALERYFLLKPDVVLLDLSMEDMSGLEVLRKLREMDAAVRVIVVSADIQRTTERMVSEGGASRFLGKPVATEDLLTTISVLLQEAPR